MFFLWINRGPGREAAFSGVVSLPRGFLNDHVVMHGFEMGNVKDEPNRRFIVDRYSDFHFFGVVVIEVCKERLDKRTGIRFPIAPHADF